MIPSDRDRIHVEHMLECIARVEEYSANDPHKFLTSKMVQDAVIRNLQTLAESSKRLSEALKTSQTRIDWRAVAGFRNVLVHDYLGLDLQAIWLVIENDLPQLKSALEEMKDRI